MLVLCTGMPRSGSTWSYNVVKQLLSRASSSVRGGYANEIGQALAIHGQNAEHVVVKSHGPDALGRAMIKQRLCRTVYTYREPLDGVLSAMEAFKNDLDQMVEAMRESLELMRFQAEAGNVLFVWYGDITESTQGSVQRIADYLELALPPEAIADVATMLSRDNVRRIIKALGKSAAQVPGNGADWDGSTLFSNHHVRDNPSDPTRVFTAAQIASIADRLGAYVDAAAMLRPEIRALGMLSAGGAGTPSWPSLSAPEPAPSEAPPEAPAAEPIDAPVAATAAAPPEAPMAADVAAIVPDAPLAADADAAPPDAPQAADADAAPPDAPLAADAADPATPTAPAPTAPPPAAPATASPPAAPAPPPKVAVAAKSHGFDPVRDAARRALARDLLGTLRPQATGKLRATRPPGR